MAESTLKNVTFADNSISDEDFDQKKSKSKKPTKQEESEKVKSKSELKAESKLELILKSIPFSGHLNYSYRYCGDKHEDCIISPFYILPTYCNNEGRVFSNLNLKGKNTKIEVGFKYVGKNFERYSTIVHFKDNFDKDNITKILKKTNKDSFIPVSKLKDMYDLTAFSEEDSNEGDYYPVLGINGKEGYYPLVLLSLNECNFKGLCVRNNLAVTYSFMPYYFDKALVTSFLNHLSKDNPMPKFNYVNVSTGENLEAEKNKKPVVDISEEKEKKVLEKEKKVKKKKSQINWEEPSSIVNFLDKYVIGQDEAKRSVAVVFTNYFLRKKHKLDYVNKDNLFLIGPSGVGKTYMISLLAEECSLPFVETKLTAKSAEGYVGENLSSMFLKLRAHVPQEYAPFGIIFLDEIDKIATFDDNGFGRKLQDELIGWIEKDDVTLEELEYSDNDANPFLSTKNLMFVAAGAFQGVEDFSLTSIIEKRLGVGRNKVGFNTQLVSENIDNSKIMHQVKPEDLIKYGLKPELIGRLSNVSVLNPLTVEDKVNIVHNSLKSPILKYSQVLGVRGYEFELADGVTELVVKRVPKETGARALSAAFDYLFKEILFNPSKYSNEKMKIIITPEMAMELIKSY